MVGRAGASSAIAALSLISGTDRLRCRRHRRTHRADLGRGLPLATFGAETHGSVRDTAPRIRRMSAPARLVQAPAVDTRPGTGPPAPCHQLPPSVRHAASTFGPDRSDTTLPQCAGWPGSSDRPTAPFVDISSNACRASSASAAALAPVLRLWRRSGAVSLRAYARFTMSPETILHSRAPADPLGW